MRFNFVDFCYKNLNNLKCYIQYRGKIYRTFRKQERLQYMYTSRCLINTFVKQKVETLKENNNSKKHFSELKCLTSIEILKLNLALENEADRNFRSYPEVHITRIVHG